MTTDPEAAPSKTPFAPRIAASESAESGTIVMMSGFFSATSRDDEAGVAPSVAISSTAVPTMSYTVTLLPAFIKFRTIGLPMMPSPMNPISAIICSFRSASFRSCIDACMWFKML